MFHLSTPSAEVPVIHRGGPFIGRTFLLSQLRVLVMLVYNQGAYLPDA